MVFDVYRGLTPPGYRLAPFSGLIRMGDYFKMAGTARPTVDNYLGVCENRRFFDDTAGRIWYTWLNMAKLNRLTVPHEAVVHVWGFVVLRFFDVTLSKIVYGYIG